MTKPWQSLTFPGNLPTKCLELEFSTFNPRCELTHFDFSGFTKLEKSMTRRTDLHLDDIDHYVDTYALPKLASAQNHYGPIYEIELTNTKIKLTEYCMSEPENPCQKTAMTLLKHLINLNLAFNWTTWTEYWDANQSTPLQHGTKIDFHNAFQNQMQTTNHH